MDCHDGARRRRWIGTSCRYGQARHGGRTLGAGAPAGTNWRDGIKIAADEINAEGGILGKKVQIDEYDTQTDPQVSRALVQKAIDGGAYVILGTIYSGRPWSTCWWRNRTARRSSSALNLLLSYKKEILCIPLFFRRTKGCSGADALLQGYVEGKDRRCGLGQQ